MSYLSLKYALFSLVLMLAGILTTACAPQTVLLGEADRTAMATAEASLTPQPPTASTTPNPTSTLQVKRELPSTRTATATNTPETFSMCSPLEMETIPELFEIVSDPYKPPPVNRAEERHHGVDFSHYGRKGMESIESEPVLTIADGRVAGVVEDRLPYGNMVIIETPFDSLPVELARVIDLRHGDSLYVLYAHMEEAPEVVIGDEVSCGERLGSVGKTGYNVVNPHLHLETRKGPVGESFGSMAFYTTTASEEELDTYIRWRTSGEFQHMDPMNVFSAYLKWLEVVIP